MKSARSKNGSKSREQLGLGATVDDDVMDEGYALLADLDGAEEAAALVALARRRTGGN